jgi:feruloyl esterase
MALRIAAWVGALGLMLASQLALPAETGAQTAPAGAPVPAMNTPRLKLAAKAPRMRCEDLTKKGVAGSPDSPTSITGAVVVNEPGRLPYCRVDGYVAPQIHFQLQLPMQGWTQRYLQLGCGGYCGGIGNVNNPRASAGCGTVVSGELARASTDDGHTAPFNDTIWGIDNPQAQVDLAYRAVHEVALTSKALIRQFYGQEPRFSYFTGCSDGGREGLMEAQRYPGDFNGVVAGAPAFIWSTLNGILQPWGLAANLDANDGYVITLDKIPALAKAAMDSCDGRDGLVDGVIDDPRACRFDPVVHQCPSGVDRADYLTPAQVAAAR